MKQFIPGKRGIPKNNYKMIINFDFIQILHQEHSQHSKYQFDYYIFLQSVLLEHDKFDSEHILETMKKEVHSFPDQWEQYEMVSHYSNQ